MSARRIPVLAFHAIQSGTGPLRIDVPTFSGIVSAMADAGFHAMTARDAGEILAGERSCPPQPVVLTFDDGYASVAESALPVLEEIGWVATVFPVTGVLGRINEWDHPVQRDLRILDRDQLLGLHQAGWEIGAHTASHRSLVGLPHDVIVREVESANATLGELVGVAPSTFAYPYGHADRRSRDIVATRYRWCWTIGASCATPRDDPARLPRIEAWYLRRPELAAALHGVPGRAWLAARRLGRNARVRLSR